MRLLATLTGVVTCVGGLTATRTDIVVRDAYLMGTRVRLSAWAPDRATAFHAVERALEVLETTEAELSTWREDSTISALNRQPVGRPFGVSASVCEMLPVLYEWHAATAGAFDPAIGRLTDAWGIHAEGRVPPTSILRKAQAASGLPLLEFDPSRCELTRRADATLDVGAFGKGEALDRVERAVTGVPWMIDLGGQVSVRGVPPDARAWRVAIAHPGRRDQALLELMLPDGSLSTSAGSERDLTVSGRRVRHILDPRTGQPAPFDGSVTVWHRRALVADILSTALFVMGPDDGLRWASRHGIAACFLLPQENGRVQRLMTTPFGRLIVTDASGDVALGVKGGSWELISSNGGQRNLPLVRHRRLVRRD